MRDLSVTLLAAQRAHPQRPRVRLLVRDKQPRLTLLGRQSFAEAQSAACTTQDGTTIVVASLDTSGRIRVRRVTDPSVLDPTAGPTDGWGWYTAAYTQVVAAGGALAWPDGDICISNNSGTLRLFYVKADGTEILDIESTDNGASWSSPATVRVVTGGTTGYRFCLASAGHDDLWYTIGRSGYRYFYMGVYSGGAWGSWTHVQYLVETGGEYGTCYGWSVQWDSASSLYSVVASYDRGSDWAPRIVSAHWDLGTATLSDFQWIVPPGIPMDGFVPWRPALFKTSDTLGPLWILTYWDTFSSGGTSWSTPVMILSRDFSHWSYRVPLAFTETTNLKRINVVEKSSRVYLHCINEAYRLDLWYAGNTSMEMTIAQNAILRYRIQEYVERGELHCELDNRGGTYDTGTAAPLRPLAQIIVEQGLNTSAGDERVECRPLYLWMHSQVRDMGVNLVRLYAVDGWQLLKMWRPECTIQWENKTVEWCIAEVAARAGNFEVETDGAAEWSQTLQYLTVAASYNDYYDAWYIKALGGWMESDQPLVAFSPDMTGLTIIRHLLGLVGGMARWGNGDDHEVLYCFRPADQGTNPAPDHTYNDGEILALQNAQSFAWPTRVRAVGSSVAFETEDVSSALACGMDFLQIVYASHWSTAGQLESMAEGALDRGLARAAGGWLRVRPNVGLEVCDIIAFTDSKAGAGLTSVKRRVEGLVTEYDPLRHVWQQMVYVEGV